MNPNPGLPEKPIITQVVQLKIRYLHGCVGSNPSLGTNTVVSLTFVADSSSLTSVHTGFAAILPPLFCDIIPLS